MTKAKAELDAARATLAAEKAESERLAKDNARVKAELVNERKLLEREKLKVRDRGTKDEFGEAYGATRSDAKKTDATASTSTSLTTSSESATGCDLVKMMATLFAEMAELRQRGTPSDKGFGATASGSTFGSGNASASSTLAGRSKVSIRMPEQFKLGNDIEVWLMRMDCYMTAMGITNSAEMAMTLQTNLTTETHLHLVRLQLPSETWQSVNALRAALRLKFRDGRSAPSFIAEFRSCRQDAREDAGFYLDRLVYLASRGLTVFNACDDSDKIAYVLQQFLTVSDRRRYVEP